MPTLFSLYVMVALNGLVRGASTSILMGLVILPFSYERQSAAMGFYQAVYAIGITLGPMIAGFVMDLSGITAAFIVIGLIGLIAPVIGLTMIGDERKGVPEYD
jgi:MFS family permease